MSDASAGNKRIAKNTFFLYLRMVFTLLVSLYTTRAILNVLGVVDYGINNVVAGFVGLFSFLNASMTNTTQRFYNFDKGKDKGRNLQDVFNTSVQIQFVLAFVTLILIECIGVWYIANKMVIPAERLSAAMWIFQFSAISLFLLFIQIPYSAAVVAHEKIGFYSVVSIIDVILKLAIALALPYLPGDKLIVYGAMVLCISFLNLLLYFIYARVHFEEIRFKTSFHKKCFRSMLSFSCWNIFDTFAYTMQGQGLNVLMNAFFGPVVNAARGVAYQVQGALSGFRESIVVAFKPQLIESYAQGDHQRTISLMYSMSKLGYLMVYVFSVPIAIEINDILSLWLNGNVPEHTSIFTILVLLNMALGSLNMPLSLVVQAVGVIRNYQTIRSLIVVAVLPISWLALAQGAPAYSVFLILVLANFVNQPVSLYLLRRVFDYSYLDYTRKVILPLLVFSLLAPILPMVVHAAMDESVLRLVTVTLVSLLASIAAAYIFVMSRSERDMVRTYVKKIMNR